MRVVDQGQVVVEEGNRSKPLQHLQEIDHQSVPDEVPLDSMQDPS